MRPDEIEDRVRKILAIKAKVIISIAGILIFTCGVLLYMNYSFAVSADKQEVFEKIKLLRKPASSLVYKKKIRGLRMITSELRADNEILYLGYFNEKHEPLMKNMVGPKGISKWSPDLDLDGPHFNNVFERMDAITNAGLFEGEDNILTVKLPSGLSLYRVSLPVRYQGRLAGYMETGILKKVRVGRILHRIRLPFAFSVVMIILIVFASRKAIAVWEARRAETFQKFVIATIEQYKSEYENEIEDMKKKTASENVEGGNFFNILEAVRDISSATEISLFIRKCVLSSVKLFKCRLVSMFSFEEGEWTLKGRYSAKGYTTDVEEKLDYGKNVQVEKLIQAGSTDLITGYPTGTSTSMFVCIISGETRMILVLQNKAGSFDTKDLVVGRVFAGYLPNLMGWHTSTSPKT